MRVGAADVYRETARLTMGSLTRSLFWDPVALRIVGQFQQDLPVVLDGVARRVALPAAGRLPLSGNLRSLAVLLQWWQVRPLPGGGARPRAGLTQRPSGWWLVVEPRIVHDGGKRA
ncbi:hypothetical protein [Streptomyces sp. NPDC059552]|uniref:hypothetical protein n=1 Tax=Streptomyces sp. NPDC059552 TaxID=3346862 RepID=UPI003699346E